MLFSIRLGLQVCPNSGHFLQIIMKSLTTRASMEQSTFCWFLGHASCCFIHSVSTWKYLYSVVWSSVRTETQILILQNISMPLKTHTHIVIFFSKRGHDFLLLTKWTKYLRLRTEESKHVSKQVLLTVENQHTKSIASLGYSLFLFINVFHGSSQVIILLSFNLPFYTYQLVTICELFQKI